MSDALDLKWPNYFCFTSRSRSGIFAVRLSREQYYFAAMSPDHCGPVEAVFSLGVGTVPDLASDSGTTLFHYSNGSVKVPGPWSRGRPKGGARKPPKKKNGAYRFVNLTAGKNTAVVHKDVSRASTKKKSQSRVPAISSPSECQVIEPSKPNFPALVSRLNLYQIQGVDPFGQTPISLKPYMLDLLRYYVDTAWRNFYTLEDLAGSNPVSEFWIPRAFKDPALIHTFVGCAVAYAYGYHAIAFQNRGLRHLQDAISVVKRRLDIPGAKISSNTLVVVAGIAMLEKGAGSHNHWEVHMQGLRDLVNYRGGREVLSSEPLILHKIYRADLFGCLDTGQRSWFDGSSNLQLNAQPTAPVRSKGFEFLFKTLDVCPPLQHCVRELESFVSFWSVPVSAITSDSGGAPGSVAKPTPIQAKHVRDALTKVQYALVSDEVITYCKQETYSGKLNNFFRITLIVYSLTILHEPTPSNMLGRQIGLVFIRAYSDVMGQSTGASRDPGWLIPQDFCLWVLFLAATAMEETECNISRRFRAMFAQLVAGDGGESLGVSYTDMKTRLERYLWVPCIHDASFERIWEDTFRVTHIGNFDATSA
ncbi:Protein of unknown function DUF3468 [Apiospora arundinis]